MAVAQINVGFQVNVKELSEKLNQAAGELEKHKAKFQEVGSAIGQAGMYVGRYVDQMAGTVITTIGGVVTFIPEIISGVTKLNAVLMANPWIALATAITAAGAALYFYTKKGNEAMQIRKMLNDVNAEALKNTAQERAEIDSLLSVAKDEGALRQDRLNAVKKLNSISPEYLGNIELETINTKETLNAVNQYVEALNSKARVQALVSKKTELYQQQIEEETRAVERFQPVADGLSRVFKGQEGVIITTKEQLEEYIKTLSLTTEEANQFRKAYQMQLQLLDAGRLKFQKKIEVLDQYTRAQQKAQGTVEALSEGTIGYYEKEIRYFENLQKNAAVSAAQHKLYANEILKYKSKIAAIEGPKVKSNSKELEKVKINTIKFYESQISALKKYQQEEAVTVDQFAETANKIQVIQQKIDAITGKREKQMSIEIDTAPIEGSIMALERQKKVLEDQMAVVKSWGGEFTLQYDVLKNKLQDIEFEIKVKADDAGLSLAKFDESYNRFIEGRENASKAGQKIIEEGEETNKRMTEAIGGSLLTLGSALADGLGGGEEAMKRFTLIMIQEIIKIIAMSQASAQAQAIEGAVASTKSTGIGALFAMPGFIAAALGMVASAFAGIPKFANGGVVSGPVLGLMGEYAGVSSNPEVIAPLNKLKEMIEPAGGNTYVTLGGGFKLTGSDLQLVLDRNTTRSKRVK